MKTKSSLGENQETETWDETNYRLFKKKRFIKPTNSTNPSTKRKRLKNRTEMSVKN